MDKLVGAVWSLALVLLDRYLDSKLDELKNEDFKSTLRRVEDHVVTFLEGPAGRAFAQAVARGIALRVTQRWFTNDPTTGTWG